MSGSTVIDVDLDARAGEIVGIAGLAGAGRSELLRLLAGAGDHRRRWLSTASCAGRQASQRRSVPAWHFVPQERRTDGLIPASIERNVNLTTLDRHAVGGIVTSRRRSRRHAAQSGKRLDLRFQRLDQPVLTLSGGNQQKVVLGKYLAVDPNVLLLDEPTRGVDVGTKGQIYRFITERAAAGATVVVVSSELLELLGLCHRIVVLHRGHVVADRDARATTEHELLVDCYGHGEAWTHD